MIDNAQFYLFIERRKFLMSVLNKLKIGVNLIVSSIKKIYYCHLFAENRNVRITLSEIVQGKISIHKKHFYVLICYHKRVHFIYYKKVQKMKISRTNFLLKNIFLYILS